MDYDEDKKKGGGFAPLNPVSPSPKPASHTALIIGAVVGGVLLLTVILIVIIFMMRGESGKIKDRDIYAAMQ